MGPTLRFSSRYGRWLTIGAAVAVVVGVSAVAIQDGWAAGLRGLPVGGLVVLLVWALFWRPEVELSDGGVTVRNVWRTAVVPWPTYRGAEVRFSLRVETSDGVVEAWAPPRSSSSARWFTRRPAAGGALPDEDARVDATAETALLAIVDRHAALERAGHLTGARTAVAAGAVQVRRTWHLRLAAATLVLLVASALALSV